MEADSLHRLMKTLVDSGAAETFEQAYEMFSKYGVRICISPEVKDCVGSQITALTAINVAARSFQGNVYVDFEDDIELRARGYEGSNLTAYMQSIGIRQINTKNIANWPIIKISITQVDDLQTIRPWANGWQFGIGHREYSSIAFPPACVAAGALAVSEAFSILRNDNPYAGNRPITLSLWSRNAEPTNLVVPPITSCWIIGLGHLGQAYAWTLGFMTPATECTLYLQDIDVVTESTLSTSVLSGINDLKQNKTRVVSQWLEARGYKTALIERRFDEFQRVGTTEPNIALFGVDNPATRRIFENAGFRFIIDAGLGSGYNDFRAIRMRTFPGPAKAADLWANETPASINSPAPAYKALLSKGNEPCGVTTLATRAVGAPFVGCVASAYVISELIRRLLNGPKLDWLDLNLRNPERLSNSDN